MTPVSRTHSSESDTKKWEPFEFAIHMEQIKESLWQ